MTLRLGADRLETRTTIVEVAERLLREEGLSAVTTRRVALEAGVQAPTLYRLFGDKEGLLDAAAEYAWARHVAGKAATETGTDPVADLRAGWEAHVGFGLANPTAFAIATDPNRRTPAPAVAAGLDVLRARVHRIAATGRLRVPEERAVQLVQAAGTSAVLTLLALPPEARDPVLAEAMYDAVLRAVLTDAPEAGTDAARNAAITLRAHAPQLNVLTSPERHLLAEWLDRVADQDGSDAGPPSR